MNNKILVLGCSWSCPHGEKETNNYYSWPELLTQKLNYKFDLLNYSQYTLSLSAQYATLYELLKIHKDNISLVIVQFTSEGRKTYTKDWKHYTKRLSKNYLTNSFNNTKNYYEYYEYNKAEIVNDYLKLSFNKNGLLNLNHGIAYELFYEKKLKNAILESYITDIQYNVGNTGHHSRLFESGIEKNIIDMLKKENVPFITFNHVSVIGGLTTRQSDFVVEDTLKDFYSYTIDEGRHFDKRGCTALLEEILYDKVQEKLRK